MMKAPPSTKSKISHHVIRRPLTATEELAEEFAVPVELLVGIDVGADEDEGVVVMVVIVELGIGDTCTNSERQTPKSGTTFDDPTQFADTHDPARRT